MRLAAFVRCLPALVVAGAAFAACTTTNPNNTYVAPPAALSGGSGTMALSSNSATQSLPAAGGFSGTVTYPGGTGTVGVSSGTTAPAGTIAVTPATLVRFASATSPSPSPAPTGTSPVVFYVTISSTAGAKLNGIPGIALVIPTTPVGTYQEATFSAATGTWSNVGTGTVNPAGTAVEFQTGSSAVTIGANGALYLAFYQGTYPAPTPTPVATPVQVLADPGFESGTAVAFPGAVSTTGWTQCGVTAAATGSTNLLHPFSTFTPVPGSTPGAFIEAAGASAPQGTSTSTPIPTQSTVPVHGGSSAAVIGGVFSSFNDADFAYVGLCQQVTIPKSPTLTMWVFGNGNEAATFVDFDVMLLDTTGKFITTLYDEQAVTATSPGDTAYRQITIPGTSGTPITGYAGQTVQLFIGIWTKSGSGSGSLKFSGYYFVDDVALMGLTH